MKLPHVKRLQPEEALLKAQQFCAWQERCHSEVRHKLLEWGIFGDQLEEIIASLIIDDFLNESRFACAYARGKFRLKGWGKIRIIRELRLRKISENCIREAFQEIDSNEYKEALIAIISKKAKEIAGESNFELNQKLLRFALQRGFESALVLDILRHTDWSKATDRD
jgi:regulatory protein